MEQAKTSIEFSGFAVAFCELAANMHVEIEVMRELLEKEGKIKPGQFATAMAAFPKDRMRALAKSAHDQVLARAHQIIQNELKKSVH
jgi:hypothetical protein